MAFDYSSREAYLLQPAKSSIIQSCSKISEKVPEDFWTFGNTVMPSTKKAIHIGICRTDKDTCKATIEENLKKSRRTLHTLEHSMTQVLSFHHIQIQIIINIFRSVFM
jgi:hypothetical protein